MKNTSILAVLLAALFLAGCAGSGLPDAMDAESVAAAALEYQAIRQVELADGGEAALLCDSAEEVARALDAECLVASRSILDPEPLVEDLGGGRIRVTAAWMNDDGLSVQSVIERQKRPAAASYDGTNEVQVTTGTETRTIEGVTVRDTEVRIEWKWDGAAYCRYRLARSGEVLRGFPSVGVSTVVEWDLAGDLVSRKLSWLKLDDPSLLEIRTLTYTPLVDGQGLPCLGPDGKPLLKIESSEWEGWAVLVSRSPRLVEYYREDGTLRLRVTHDPTPGQPGQSVTREYFDLDGNLLKTSVASLRLSMDGDALTLVREVGGRKVTTAVTETETGISVEYEGAAWSLVQNEDGSLDLVAPDGSRFHVVIGMDGTPVVS